MRASTDPSATRFGATSIGCYTVTSKATGARADQAERGQIIMVSGTGTWAYSVVRSVWLSVSAVERSSMRFSTQVGSAFPAGAPSSWGKVDAMDAGRTQLLATAGAALAQRGLDHARTALIRESICEARREGFALYRGNIEDLLAHVPSLGFTPGALGPGRPALQELRPQTQTAAPRSSMSALFGLAALPLHTDGANLDRPPDLVALHATATTSVPTYVLPLRAVDLSPDDRIALEHGLFRVRSRSSSRIITARFSTSRVRFDPVCMIPLDRRARRVVSLFATAATAATAHHWHSGETLLIDNSQTLHGRGSANSASDRLVLRLAMWRRTS